MTPWKALSQGATRIWLHKRLIGWLYIINIAFAATLIVPFRNFVERFAKTDLAQDMRTGFSFGSFIDYWHQYHGEFDSLRTAAIGLGVLFLVFNIFLTGGIISTLSTDRRVPLRRFLAGAGRYFGRNFRLFLLQAISIGAVIAGYKFLLSDVFEEYAEIATTDVASFLWAALGVGIVAIVLSFVVMVFDYAKIRAVVTGKRSMFVGTWAAMLFSIRRMFSVIPLFYLNLLIVGLLFGGYLLLESFIPNDTLPTMIGLFVVQQLLVIGRIWTRLSFFSSQMSYYKAITAPKTAIPGVRSTPPYPTLRSAPTTT